MSTIAPHTIRGQDPDYASERHGFKTPLTKVSGRVQELSRNHESEVKTLRACFGTIHAFLRTMVDLMSIRLPPKEKK